MRETIAVSLGDRSYEVRVGEGLIASAADQVSPLLVRPRVAILTDENVAETHLAALKSGLGDIEVTSLALPPGEATKSWSALERSVEWLLAEKIERRDIMIALGGGVIGDLGGFAAAIVRRSIRYVQVPTSLLAQVDSSV
ncbi:MAG: iron-containing alcohol dehydrogenase, partial [Alphaproteobacteria bacterium]|nr:iron-containing alcohol dehydrogenase [Alphaproteobacteria bacterium]